MREAPIARSIAVGRCNSPSCNCVHLDLLGEDDEPIAFAAVPISEVKEFVKNIQDAAYAVAVIKGQHDDV